MPRHHPRRAVHVYGPSSTTPPPTAPTLDALVQPLLFPEGGGGNPVTLPGTNLSTVTLVHVGSASIAPTSSTSSTVTFVWPTLAASAAPYDVSVTSTGGSSNVLTGAAYSLPACVAFCWYAAEGFNAGTGAWKDVIGGLTATVAPAHTKCTVNATWIASPARPALNWAGASAMEVTIPPLSQPGAMWWVGDLTSSLQLQLLDSNTDLTNRWTVGGGYPASFTIFAYSPPNEIDTAITVGSPSFLEVIFNGASSSVSQNDTTTTAGTLGVTPSAADIVFGVAPGASGREWIGNWAMLALLDAAPTAPQSAIMAGIATSLGWI